MMGEDSPNLVLIPPGIWHGFKAMGDTGAYLLHLNDQAFNFGQPDEEKIAIDDPRIPYRW
jgi:dTDP-4-dehydrorhamnose 3,5-epimerase